MKKEEKLSKKIFFIGAIVIGIILLVSIFSSLVRINNLKEEMNNIKDIYEDEIDSLKTMQKEKIAGMSAIDYSPTLSEVKEVIKNNKIENMEYDDEAFNCVEFSNNLVKAFQEAKIYSCVTELWFEEGAHANVVVNTSDRGIIYIEPQDDKIIYNLEIGDDYCDKVDWNCEQEDWELTHIKHCYS